MTVNIADYSLFHSISVPYVSYTFLYLIKHVRVAKLPTNILRSKITGYGPVGGHISVPHSILTNVEAVLHQYPRRSPL